MKLSDKINLYTAVMFIMLLILTNGSIYFTFSKMMFESDLKRTAAEAEQAVAGMNKAETLIQEEELMRVYVPVNGMLQIVYENGARGLNIASPNLKDLREIPVTLYKKEVLKIIESAGTPHAFVSIPIVTSGGEVAELQFIENLKSTANMLTILRVVLVIATVIATITVLISSRLLSNFISRPVTTMIATMQEIRSCGHFKRIQLPKMSKDELYQMGETFNSMIDLLEINYEKQGQFIANASHELKTPLTVIEAYASLLKRRGNEEPKLFEESIQAIHSEAIRMKDMTEQLLLLARQDMQLNVKMEDLHLSNIIKNLVQTYQNAYHRSIELQVEAEVIARGDLQSFKQLFYILMDNARKYSEDKIEVQIGRNNQKAFVEICDRGIGIPADELNKIFDRFYRVDKTRTRKTGGFGLGLSLAKEIAEVMDAQVQIESIEGYGTRAKILLILVNSQ